MTSHDKTLTGEEVMDIVNAVIDATCQVTGGTTI